MGIFDGFGFGNNYAAPLMGFANSAQSALPGLDYEGALGNAAKGLPTQSPFAATNGNTGIVPPPMQQPPDGMPYQPAALTNDLGGLPYQRTTPNPADPRQTGIGMSAAFAPMGGGGGIDGRAVGQNPFVTF